MTGGPPSAFGAFLLPELGQNIGQPYKVVQVPYILTLFAKCTCTTSVQLKMSNRDLSKTAGRNTYF